MNIKLDTGMIIKVNTSVMIQFCAKLLSNSIEKFNLINTLNTERCISLFEPTSAGEIEIFLGCLSHSGDLLLRVGVRRRPSSSVVRLH